MSGLDALIESMRTDSDGQRPPWRCGDCGIVSCDVPYVRWKDTADAKRCRQCCVEERIEAQ